MNLKIGKKIKQLRKQTNTTQEQLAAALGLTGQAISKWESENGYPDITYLTPLANFFNTTIDDLFDHNQAENQERKEAIINENMDYIIHNKPIEQRIEFLKKALEEFPAEKNFPSMLAEAYFIQFINQGNPKKWENGIMYWDYEKFRQFKGWQEAINLYEKGVCSLSKERLVALYSRIGETEKALEASKEIPTIYSCKERVLAKSLDGELRELLEQTSIFRHFQCSSYDLIWLAAGTKNTKIVSEAYETVIRLWNLLFSDGNFASHAIHGLYEGYSAELVKQNRHPEAIEALKNAFHHAKMYDKSITEMRKMKRGEVFRFTAPLVNKLELVPYPSPSPKDEPIQMYEVPTGTPDETQRLLSRLNSDESEIKKALQNNPEYIALLQECSD